MDPASDSQGNKRREVAWRRYKTFSSDRNYKEDKKVRNEATATIHQDHLTYQRKLVQYLNRAKRNSMHMFEQNSRSRRKCLEYWSLMAAGQLQTRKLGEQFQSVFSHEMATDIVADNVTETIPLNLMSSSLYWRNCPPWKQTNYQVQMVSTHCSWIGLLQY